MTFGEWIRGKRKAGNLTLEEVGKAVGIGKSSISKLERGLFNGMNISRIRPLCNALHITADELLDAWEKYGNS